MKTLRQIMTLLVMACIVFASSTAFAASLQDEVLYEVNLERTAAGIQPLSGIVYLEQAAGTRAQEAGILFAHQRPDGSSVKSVLNGASCSWFGENLAISSVVDAKKDRSRLDGFPDASRKSPQPSFHEDGCILCERQ